MKLWFREIVKLFAAFAFAYFSWACWEAGKLASLDILSANSYKLMIFGYGGGLVAAISIMLFVDVIASIYKLASKTNQTHYNRNPDGSRDK